MSHAFFSQLEKKTTWISHPVLARHCHVRTYVPPQAAAYIASSAQLRASARKDFPLWCKLSNFNFNFNQLYIIAFLSWCRDMEIIACEDFFLIFLITPAMQWHILFNSTFWWMDRMIMIKSKTWILICLPGRKSPPEFSSDAPKQEKKAVQNICRKKV